MRLNEIEWIFDGKTDLSIKLNEKYADDLISILFKYNLWLSKQIKNKKNNQDKMKRIKRIKRINNIIKKLSKIIIWFL